MVIGAWLRYAINFEAYDELLSYVDGRQEKVKEANRIISGVIQPIDDKTVDLDFAGQISSGSFMLHSMTKLYTADKFDRDQINNRQSYVIYANEIWKVIGVKYWGGYSSGINKYLLEKYTDNE